MLTSHGGPKDDEEDDIDTLLGVGGASKSNPVSPSIAEVAVPLPLFPVAPRTPPTAQPTDEKSKAHVPVRKSPAPPMVSASTATPEVIPTPVAQQPQLEVWKVDDPKAPLDDIIGHLKAQLASVQHDAQGKNEKARRHSQCSSPLTPILDHSNQAFETPHAGHLGTSRGDGHEALRGVQPTIDFKGHDQNPLAAPHMHPPAEEDLWQEPRKAAPHASPHEALDGIWEEPITDTVVNVQLLQNGAARSEATPEVQLDVAFKRLRVRFDLFVRKMLHSGHTGCFVGIALGAGLSVIPSFLFIWYFLIPFASNSDVELAVMATVSFGIMCAGIFASCGYIIIRRRPATWDFDGRLRRRNPECIALAEADHKILRLLQPMVPEDRLAYLQKDDSAGLKKVYLQCLERMGRVEAPPEEATGGPTASTAGLVLKARFQAQLQREHIWQNFGDCWF